MLPTFPGDFKNISCARENSIIALAFRTTSRATNKQEIVISVHSWEENWALHRSTIERNNLAPLFQKTVEDIACNNPFV